MEQPLILDRYRPLEDLATGGFGEVVLAFDTRMQRRVAIKRMPITPARGVAAVTPIGLAEARTAALLNHPAIVTVHEWDTDSDEAFIIMEYIDGLSLARLLDEEGPLDLDEAAAVVASVAEALEFAHYNGVLHLDIKPENVLITRDGLVKVTDFGVAALSEATGHGPAVGGTLGFMPLEQLRGAEVDERTDVWAFAALCYEMLTDANPFSSESVEGAIFKAEIVDPPAPSEFASHLAAAIDDILLAALSTHQIDRYADIEEFSTRLLDHLGDPQAGQESLAEITSAYVTEQPDSAKEGMRTLGLWDRMGPWTTRLGRGVAALGAGWLAWAGILPIAEGTYAPLAAGIFAGVAALLAPGLGVGVALLALGAGIAAAGWWWAAIGLLLVSAAAWWVAGREGGGLTPAVITPALGSIKLSLASPMIAGFVQRPLQAAVNGAFGALLVMLASAASGARAPYLDVGWALFRDPLGSRVVAGGVRELLSTPAPLAVMAAWALAAALMSLMCRLSHRPAAFAGAALAGLTLYGGYLAAEFITQALSAGDASATWLGENLLPHFTASLILMVLVIAAGPPVRAEEE